MLRRIGGTFLSGALVIPSLCLAAVNFFNPMDTSAIPKRLSQTGVYSNITTKTVDTALKYFEINSPLWSDGATKTRWIVLPPGTHVTYVDSTDLFDYPNGTRFIKLFRHERISDDSTSLVYWETRLLVNRENVQGYDEWYGFSYKWNADATEASLVNPENGFDTSFYYHPKSTSQPQSYKKWHFPSQTQCRTCHQTLLANTVAGTSSTRGVLGFFPAQLKLPAPLQPGVDQITYLFNQGVFTGSPPTQAQLGRHWKGIHETIPAGLTPDQRFAVIDTMARSYIGANCSGCHGTRGARVTPQIPASLNYDFFNLRPVMEFAYQGTSSWGLERLDTNSIAGGRNRYILSILKAGLDTSTGSTWNMIVPPGNSNTVYPGLIYPKYPSYSTLLYRIAARSAPWFDSANVRNSLKQGDPNGMLPWIFSQPWGSATWRDLLVQHNVKIDSLISYFYDDQQMPPLASYMPDTVALKILGEWVRSYRTLYIVDSSNIVTRLNSKPVPPRNIPMIRNRILFVPEDWRGRALMIGIQGRTYRLYSLGKNRYIIPPYAPAGVYFFAVGGHHFKTSIFTD